MVWLPIYRSVVYILDSISVSRDSLILMFACVPFYGFKSVPFMWVFIASVCTAVLFLTKAVYQQMPIVFMWTS